MPDDHLRNALEFGSADVISRLRPTLAQKKMADFGQTNFAQIGVLVSWPNHKQDFFKKKKKKNKKNKHKARRVGPEGWGTQTQKYGARKGGRAKIWKRPTLASPVLAILI